MSRPAECLTETARALIAAVREQHYRVRVYKAAEQRDGAVCSADKKENK